MLTEQELNQIRAEAERLYPFEMKQYNAGEHRGMFGMCDSNYYEREAYIAAATLYQERIKGLLEAASDILLLCEENGKPVDGYRFREMVLKLKNEITNFNESLKG